MSVTHRGLDVGVVQRPLHQLEVASLTQQLGTEVMAVIVKPEILHARCLASSPPGGFQAADGDRVTLALDLSVSRALRYPSGEDPQGSVFEFTIGELHGKMA